MTLERNSHYEITVPLIQRFKYEERLFYFEQISFEVEQKIPQKNGYSVFLF